MNGTPSAVSALYEVFRGYPLREIIPGCPHCRHQGSANYALHQKRLSELTPVDLEDFCFHALTTLGDLNDWKHFLPRILELMVDGDFEHSVDPEILFGKLAYGGWRQWPKAEMSCVREFLVSFWDEKLSLCIFPEEGHTIDTWLCCIGIAEDCVGPYLTQWEARNDEAAVLNFVNFFIMNANSARAKGRLQNAYWDKTHSQTEVVQWLNGSFPKNILERLVCSDTYSAFPQLEAAFDLL